MLETPRKAGPDEVPSARVVQPRRAKRWLGRAGLFAAPFVVALVVGESLLRPVVGRSGTTPSRTPTIDGLPHQLRPGFRTLYKGVEVEINDAGFRGARPAPTREAQHRIAVIGDSIVFGNGIPLEDTLPVLLEAALDAPPFAVEVLNFGVPGYNASSVATTLREQVLSCRPDLVLYIATTNDGLADRGATEVPPDARIDEFEAFPLRSAALQWSGVRAKGLLRSIGLGTGSGHAAHLVRDFERHGGRGRTRLALKEMRRCCQERGVQLVVAMFPYLVSTRANPLAPIEEGFAEHCRRLGIEFLDLSEAFGEDEKLSKYWANAFDPHPNRAANERVVSYLVSRLPGVGG